MSKTDASDDSKRGAWTPEEDELLRRLVASHGPQKWAIVAKRVKGRSGKSCRLRWWNHLSPEVKKGPFTEWEDAVIIKAHQANGNRWSVIAKMMPGRTDNAIKNRWNSTLKRKSTNGSLINRYIQQCVPLQTLLTELIDMRDHQSDHYAMMLDASADGAPGSFDEDDGVDEGGAEDTVAVAMATIPTSGIEHKSAAESLAMLNEGDRPALGGSHDISDKRDSNAEQHNAAVATTPQPSFAHRAVDYWGLHGQEPYNQLSLNPWSEWQQPSLSLQLLPELGSAPPLHPTLPTCPVTQLSQPPLHSPQYPHPPHQPQQAKSYQYTPLPLQSLLPQGQQHEHQEQRQQPGLQQHAGPRLPQLVPESDVVQQPSQPPAQRRSWPGGGAGGAASMQQPEMLVRQPALMSEPLPLQPGRHMPQRQWPPQQAAVLAAQQGYVPGVADQHDKLDWQQVLNKLGSDEGSYDNRWQEGGDATACALPPVRGDCGALGTPYACGAAQQVVLNAPPSGTAGGLPADCLFGSIENQARPCCQSPDLLIRASWSVPALDEIHLAPDLILASGSQGPEPMMVDSVPSTQSCNTYTGINAMPTDIKGCLMEAARMYVNYTKQNDPLVSLLN